MIQIRNLKLPADEPQSALTALAAKKLRLPPEAIGELRILKRSLDARKKDDIRYVYTVGVTVPGGEERAAARAKSPDTS